MRLRNGWKAWGLAGRPTTAVAVGPKQTPPANLEEFLSLLAATLAERIVEMSPEDQALANRELQYLGQGVMPDFPERALSLEEGQALAQKLVENAPTQGSPLVLWLQGVREDLEAGSLMDPAEAESELAEPVADWLHQALENVG